jgi:hypothetical protein
MARQFGSAPVNWTADTIKVALVTSSYTPDIDADEFWIEVLGDESSGTGYTTGGEALTGKSIGSVVSGHRVPLLASPTSWTSATVTFRYAVVYKDTGSAATSPLLGYIDFGADESVSNGTINFNWGTNGVLYVSA